MAKDFLNTAMESQRHYNVDSHSWTLWLGSIPILQDLDQMLYDLVHTPHVKQYWMSKSWIRENNFTLVHWPRLGKALDKMSLSRRLFCLKHTAGMLLAHTVGSSRNHCMSGNAVCHKLLTYGITLLPPSKVLFVN
jgi:hypothetical protein